eukprot:TRINITY_DN2382_c0_g2_i1.p1 TRINITY_DN2382_c0_g2~~TRINITY_DN2382_c0_g2_i1.p1  ORF type:complete len:528 (+),score=143.09 TRINITY_DN2382_c0_g2_i1:170-1753(+)
MTEYGVQTNNLFDLLNENDSGVAARPKQAPAGQQQKGPKKAQPAKSAQPAKQAQAPKKPAEPKQQAPTQPKPAAAVQPSTGGDEGYTTVKRTERPPAPQGQQGQRPQGGFRNQGQGPRPQGQQGGQGGGFRQQGNQDGQNYRQQGGQGGGFRQGGGQQGGQGGGFRQQQGGQGGGFRQQQGGQGGGFRQGGQGGQGGGNRGNRPDRLDDRFVNFNDKEVNAAPNKVTAEGPRHGETESHAVPQKAGGKGRQFDRQSPHAPNEAKKGGSGPGNWGKNTGEDELKAEADVQAELAAGPEGNAPAVDGATTEKKKKKKKKATEEEEDKDKKDEIPDEKLVLFDDYQKQQAKSNKLKVKLPAARQAGEGAKEDPKWAAATKLDRSGDEVVYFTKAGEEKPKAEAAKTGEKKLLSKNQYKKAKERKAREAAKAKLQQENITNLFDFSAKKEHESRSDRPRGERSDRPRGERPRGGERSDRPRGPRQDRPEGAQGPRGGRGNSAPAGGPPKKFNRPSDAPQFDDSSFPALQLQ